jgi:hypothetical protein
VGKDRPKITHEIEGTMKTTAKGINWMNEQWNKAKSETKSSDN